MAEATGNVIRTNPAARELYGMDLTGDRLVEHATFDLRIRRPDGTPMPATEFPSRRALTGERVLRAQYLFVAKDGADRVGEVSATPLFVNGRVAGAVAIARDITERKQIEADLRSSEEKFAKAFHGNTAAMAITRMRDGLYIEVNDRFVDMTGFRREDVIGRTTGDIGVWKDPNDREAFVRDLQQTGVVRNRECRFLRPGGEEWIALVSSQVSEIQGKAVLVSSLADITEGKRAERALRDSEEALREANARLAEADRRKDEFLAVLSHELRNPLAPIRAALYLLEHAAPGGEQANRARTVIDRQVAQLARLVDDLLDVTRITRGKIHLHLERLELTGLVARTAEDHRDLFATRGVDLRVDLPGEHLWVDGDEQRLAQVVGNLLHNAAKFTEPGGHTTVRVTREDATRTAVLSVRDTGVGIGPTALTRLFEPFMQVDDTLDRARGGLGLGLSLVKSLTEMHGGTVSVRSDGVGHGTEFTIRLPLRAAPAAAAPPRIGATHTPRRILFSPTVMLIDLGMPDVDGYALIDRIRRSDSQRSMVPAIALTAYAGEQDRQRALASGFQMHIAKPANAEALVHAVGRMASLARQPSSRV
jgi:two-component system CheB/CheR fusion protein